MNVLLLFPASVPVRPPIHEDGGIEQGKLNPMTREAREDAERELRELREAARRDREQSDGQQRQQDEEDFGDLFDEEIEVEEADDVEAELFGPDDAAEDAPGQGRFVVPRATGDALWPSRPADLLLPPPGNSQKSREVLLAPTEVQGVHERRGGAPQRHKIPQRQETVQR